MYHIKIVIHWGVYAIFRQIHIHYSSVKSPHEPAKPSAKYLFDDFPVEWNGSVVSDIGNMTIYDICNCIWYMIISIILYVYNNNDTIDDSYHIYS